MHYNSIHGWLFFPFSPLNMSSQCFLVCSASAEKSADYLCENSLHLTSCFSIAASQIPYLVLTFAILIIMCLSMSLFGFTLLWVFWASCICIYTSFSQIWGVVGHYFFKYALCCFLILDPYDMHNWSFLWCFISPLGSIHFSSFIFTSQTL